MMSAYEVDAAVALLEKTVARLETAVEKLGSRLDRLEFWYDSQIADLQRDIRELRVAGF